MGHNHKFMRNSIYAALLLIFFVGIVYVYIHYDVNKATANGTKFYQAGKYEEALAQFEKGLKSNKWERAELGAISCYKKLHKFNDGINFLLLRLNSVPDRLFDPIRLYNLGKIYKEQLRDNLNAEKYFKLSVEKYKDPASANELAEIYEKAGDLEKAIQLREFALSQMTATDSYAGIQNRIKRLKELSALYVKKGRPGDADLLMKEVKALQKKGGNSK